MRITSSLIIFFFATASLSQNSTVVTNQKKPDACFYAKAALELNNNWTPVTWSIWTLVYGVLPLIAEIVLAVLLGKLTRGAASHNQEPTTVISIQEVINEPGQISAGMRLSLALANNWRFNKNDLFSQRSNAATNNSPKSGLSAQDIITILMFVFTSGFYAAEKFMQATCDAQS